MMVIIAGHLLILTLCAVINATKHDNKTKQLEAHMVESIRRQLMTENYDYMSVESDFYVSTKKKNIKMRAHSKHAHQATLSTLKQDLNEIFRRKSNKTNSTINFNKLKNIIGKENNKHIRNGSKHLPNVKHDHRYLKHNNNSHDTIQKDHYIRQKGKDMKQNTKNVHGKDNKIIDKGIKQSYTVTEHNTEDVKQINKHIKDSDHKIERNGKATKNDDQRSGNDYQSTEYVNRVVDGVYPNIDVNNTHNRTAERYYHTVRIGKSDLLYYVDDEMLNQPGNKIPAGNDKVSEKTTSDTLKYKVFKVKQSKPNRRSNMPFRRFLEEEGENGIVIIPLDNQPLPEFRLPDTRRHYLTHEEENNSFDVVETSDITEERLKI